MAQRIVYLDDRDGTELEDSSPVTIRVGDVEWTADLSEDNRQKVITWVTAFIPEVSPETASRSRTTSRGNRSGARSAVRAVRDNTAVTTGSVAEARSTQRLKIEEWVKSLSDEEKKKFPEGTRLKIGTRGRIDHAVLKEFYARHPGVEQLFSTSG